MMWIVKRSRAAAIIVAVIALWSSPQRADAITLAACAGFGGTVKYDNCYKVDSTARTWAASETAAQALDPEFHLASIRSAVEDAFVLALMKSIALGEYWIGLNDIAVEGTFVWSDGTVVDYSNWSPGEPNNSGNEDFVVINTGFGYWNDLGASERRPAVFSARVPEPTALALMGLGLAGIGCRRQRNKTAL